MDMLLFGTFRLDRQAFSLIRCGPDGADERIALRPKGFDILRYLVENAGRIVSQDEFLSALWPNTHVQPEVLKGHILAVRTSLGDRDGKAKYIETVRGRGYRFVAEVRPLATASLSDQHEQPFLVGRDAARAELEHMLRRARAGNLQLAFITGEAGIGKTALTEEVSAAAAVEDATVFFGRCLPGGGETDVYYPILEILSAMSRGPLRDRLAATLVDVAPAWLVQLPGLAPGQHTEIVRATPHRIARELCDAFAVLARDRLIVLVLEDIHWADQATIELIQALANRRLRTRMVILATLRLPGSSETGFTAGALVQKLSLYRLAREIRLQRLGADDIAAFVSHSVHPDPPERLTRLLHQRSEGNPLFMRAILDVLLQHQAAEATTEGWRLHDEFEAVSQAAPPDLVQIIEGEIQALPVEAQNVLEAGALAEGWFSPWVHHVAAGVDEEAFERVCEALCRRSHLIRRGDLAEMPNGRPVQTYVFRHALFQEVAHDRQGAVQRTARHTAIATRLEAVYAEHQPAIASSLVRHYAQAALWPQAIGALRMVARTAMRRFAMREAAAVLQQGIDFSRRLREPDRQQVELDLLDEQSRIYLGTYDPRAAEAFERLAAKARKLGRSEVETRALFGLGYVVSWTNRDGCIEILQEVLARSAGIADPLEQARLRCCAHTWLCWSQGWSAPDVAGFQESNNVIVAQGDSLIKAAADLNFSLVLFCASRYAEAISLHQQGMAVIMDHVDRESVDLSLPLWVERLGYPWGQLLLGQLGDSLSGFTASAAASEADGEIGRSATLRLYHAFAFERIHDYPAALSIVGEAVALLRAHGLEFGPNERQIELVLRGLAHLGLGELDPARERLLAARAHIRAQASLSSWYWRAAGEAGLAEYYLVAGDLDEAAACASGLLTRARALEERTWRGFAADVSARIAMARGQLDEARDILRQGWSDIEGYETALVRGRLHAIEARVAELSGAPAAAERHRVQMQMELDRLAASLPADHPGRERIITSRPFTVEPSPRPSRLRKARA